jgi:hypothetical protein
VVGVDGTRRFGGVVPIQSCYDVHHDHLLSAVKQVVGEGACITELAR